MDSQADYNSVYKKFTTNFEKLNSYDDRINESDTRLRIIDTFLFEILGWEKSEIDTEKHNMDGYSDYAVKLNSQVILIIEAKRAGSYFWIDDDLPVRNPVYVNILLRKNNALKQAFDQAVSYAIQEGAKYVAITNGKQWIITATFIEGQNLENRRCFVFKSLDDVLSNITDFWTCLCKEGLASGLLFRKLIDAKRVPAPPRLSVSIPDYPKLSNRNLYSNELSYILKRVWEALETKEQTNEFMKECYVTSSSNAPLVQYARDILSAQRKSDACLSYDIIDASTINHNILTKSSAKPYVILGRVGHGKSTFLNYLRVNGASNEFKDYIHINIDFIDRPDDASFVNGYVYESISTQLLDRYDVDIDKYEFVKGVLYKEFERYKNSYAYRSAGSDEKLKSEAERQFYSERTRDRHEFLKYVINHLKKGMNRSVALFFDNLDRRDTQIQEEAFLKASSIARDWQCVVFICLRPDTFYNSLRNGVIDSLSPKTFTIGAPDLSLVLKRRFNYAKRISTGAPDDDCQTEKSTGRMHLLTAAKIFDCCAFSARSSRSNRNAMSMLESISNGNIRDMLNYANQVLTGQHLDTKKIVDFISKGDKYFIPEHEASKSLLYGDYIHYDPNNSLFVNLFDIYSSDSFEHFARFATLFYLSRSFNKHDSNPYVKYSDLQQYLLSLGLDAFSANRHCTALYNGKCIEIICARDVDNEEVKKVRIETKGIYHLYRLVPTFLYLDAVTIDTPITSPAVRASIVDTDKIEQRLERTDSFIKYLLYSAESILDEDVKAEVKKQLTEAQVDISNIKIRIMC